MAVRHAWGRIESGDAMYSYPPSLSVFPVVSCFVTRGFALAHPCHDGIQCRCCQFRVACVPMLRRPTSVFYPAASCRRWRGKFCTFVRSDAWLNFSWDLVSLRTKTCQREEQMRRQFTCHHSSHSQLLEEGLSTILSSTRAVLFQGPRAQAVLH